MADLEAIRKKLEAVKAARDSAVEKTAEKVRGATAGNAGQARTYTRKDGGRYSDNDLSYRFTPTADDPSAYYSRRRGLVTDTLQAGRNAIGRARDTGSVQNVGSLYRELLAQAGASRARGEDAKAWEQESAGIGSQLAAKWYASAARTTGTQADELDQAAKGLMSNERLRQENATLDYLRGRERELAVKLYQGSGARELTAEEQQGAAASTRSDIAEAEARLEELNGRDLEGELAAAEKRVENLEISERYGLPIYGITQARDDVENIRQEIEERDNLPTYIDALKNAEGKLDSETPVTVYDNDYEKTQQEMQDTRAGYLQTRKNIDDIGDYTKTAKERLDAYRWDQEQKARWAAVADDMATDGWKYDYSQKYAFDRKVREDQNVFERLAEPIMGEDLRLYYTLEQASIYEYLLSQGREDEAKEYADYIEEEAAARRNQIAAKTEEEMDWGAGYRALRSVASNPFKVINSGDIAIQKIDRILSGSVEPIKYERSGYAGVISNTNREVATEQLNEYGTLKDFVKDNFGVELGWWADLGWGDIMGAGIDTANSFVNTALFGTGGAGTAMGAEKFSDEYRDAKERGGTDSQAFNYALGSSIAEGLGEHIVVSDYFKHLAGIGRAPTLRGKLALGLVQMAEGAAQEGATTVMERVVDEWTMGENTKFDVRVRELMAEGYDYETATGMAQDEMDNEIIQSAILGAIGEGMGTTAGVIVNTPESIRKSREHNAEVGGAILQNGNAVDMARRIGEFSGKPVKAARTNRQATRQYERFMDAAEAKISETMRAEDDQAVVDYYRQQRAKFMESAGAAEGGAQTVQSGVENRSSAAKKSVQREALKEGYLEGLLKKAAGGETLNKQEAFAVERSDAARETLSAIKNKTLSVDRTKSGRQLKLAGEIAGAVKGPIDGTSEGARAKAEKRAEGMRVSDAGASVGGEPVKVNGITRVAGENGEAIVTVTMPDGSAREVNMSEVTFSRENAELYSYAADMASREVANAFRTLYTKDQGMTRVAAGMDAAYDMGRAGYRNIETVRKSVLTSELTDQQLTTAYELGVGARTAEQNRIVTAAAFRAKEAMGNEWRGGQVTYDNVNPEALSAEQRRDAELAAVIAGLSGKNVELFESQADESGRYVGENGSYNAQTNTIRLDVNAGRNNRRDSMAQTALMKTMSHELTHDIQNNAPKEYARLKGAILDVLESQEGADLNDLVDAKLARDGRLSREAAVDEVVADACEGMLSDSDFAQRMREAHPEAARTLGERLKELLGRIMDAIKAAFNGKRLSREANMIMREAERYREIADMWAEGAQKAAEVTGRTLARESESAMESEAGGESGNTERGTAEEISEVEAAGKSGKAATETETIPSGEQLVGEHDEPAQPAEAHIDNRTWDSVAERSVAPFMNDYRYARSYMGVAAKALLQDAQDTIPGKRYMTPDGEWKGQDRVTTEPLGRLKDGTGKSWADIRGTLKMLSDTFDAGDLETELPNNALIKRTELVLDEMLTDGYTTLDGTRINPATDYLAYKAALPGAAKQVTPEAPAGGVDFGEYVLFSMRNPVEQTGTLMAVHNITEKKLEKALKLGGLPMPSIAIAKTDIGHQNFGGISLVFGKSTVDPQADRRNKTYSADAWTPTFPKIEYEVDKNADARIYNKLIGIEGRLDEFFAQELSKIKYGTEDMLNSYGGEEGLIQKALNNYGLKAAYLEENGGHAEVVRRQQEQKTGYSEEQAQKYAAIVELIGEEALKKSPVSELYDKYSGQIEAIWPGSTKMRLGFSRLLQNAANYADKRNQPPRTETVTDEAATRKALDDRIDAAEYESWVRELYNGIVKASGVYNGKDPYTSTGNRRSFSSTHYPATVEGIVRAMHDAYGGKTKNVSNMYNVKTLRAVTSKTFKSIDEMHMNEGRLRARTQEEADALTSELDKRLNTLTARILSDKNGGKELSLYDQITSQDQISAILHETAAKKYSAATIKKGLAEYGYEISEATARELKALFDDISEMPVNIFEAKPERAVYFDEVEYAIVPDDMSSAVRSELDKVVADVREYPAGDEARRLELLNERDDVKFSMRDGIEFVEDKYYARLIDRFEEQKPGGYIKVGRVNANSVLHRIGLPEADLFFDNSKIYKALSDHSDHLDKDSIKAVPEILRNPVVITEDSRPNNINVFGNVWVGNSPLLVGIVITKSNSGKNIINKIRTIHARRDAAQKISDESVLYLDNNKKRTRDWFQTIGTHLPRGGTKFGFIRSISLSDDLVNPETQYQPRDEQISIRELLANVIEDASTSADEMAWLKGYRKDLKELDKKLDAIGQNKQIIRELMFKKGRTTEETGKLNKARERLKILQEQVTRMDEGLLKLEGSDFIRGLVNREAKKIRDMEAEKRRAGIAKVRQTQRNTAVRKNIRQRAKRLDRMLREPTDRDHIPEGLKGAMLDLMDIFTRSDDSAFGGAAKDRERLYRAQREYEAMRSADPESDIASRYDEDTADRLRQLGDLMNDGKLTEFGAAELAEVSKVLEHFEHLIRDQNDEFRESRRKKTEEYAREIWQQTGTMKGRKENAFTANALVKSIKHMGQANVTPVYFYKHLGGAMGRLGNELLKAEGRYGVNAGRAEARISQIKEAHGYESWAAKKGDILRLETESGEVLELTREQALGIWASAKRERTNTIQRAEHLRTGGVILEKAARKAGLKGQELNLTPTKISDNDIAKIDNWLTDQQKKYADAMVNYISTDMAELGNETSMELVGYKKFGEGYYYPYKTSGDFRRTNLGNVEQALIKNMGFTKATVRNAKTPVVITDFSQTVAEHVNAMLMYNAFAAPQDQLMRVYDFRLDDSTSVKNMLRSAYGDEAPGYIEQQMRDLYGGVSPDRDAGLVNRLISGHKRQAVLGSASVVIQQPTAIFRAMCEVNLKYFAGKQPGGGFEEAKQYAGTAVIKDMGGFDTSMSRGATDWINGKPSDWQNHPVRSTVDKINELAGMGAEKADQLAWSLLWKAVKKEQADKTGLDINSEELKQKAGERFDEVVRLTQVYDSVMSKSQLMRNKNVFWKGATAFMAEPTVTMNMMLDMVFEARKGNKKKASGILLSVLTSIIFTNLAKALVTAGRDDDDEEATWFERYVKNATDGLINDLIPFNYVPIARDVYSKLQGYDVERTDMSIINDILAASETILNPDSSPYKRAKSGVQVLSIITKIPAHNLWREVEAAINTATATPPSQAREGWLENAVRTGLVEATPIGKWFDLEDSKARSADKLFEALVDGDAESAGEWKKHLMLYNGSEDEKAVNGLLRSRIKEGYENGELDRGKAVDMLTEHAGMKRYDAEKRVSEWSYAVDTGTAYGDVKAEYLNGNLTDEAAIAARVEYGGADGKEAAATVAKWRYEKDTGIAYGDMAEAYISGDITEAQAIAAQEEYGGLDAADAKAAVKRWDFEKETGIAYANMKDAYISGELTDGEAIAARMEYGGAREAEAHQTIAEWKYEKETGGEWGEMKADYIAGRMTGDEVVAAQVNYGGAFEKDVRAQLLKWDYERDTGMAYTDMKGEYLEGGISREDAVDARIKYGGLEANAAELDVSKWDFEADYGYGYDDMRDYYELGRLSGEEAIAAQVKYGKTEEDKAYFNVAGWEYEQETGGEWNGKFTKVHDAVDSGSGADLRSSIQEVYDHSAYADGKKAASAVTSNITSTYKPIYLAGTPAQRAAMEPQLLTAYRMAYELAGEEYYGDEYKLKQIRKWAEE